MNTVNAEQLGMSIDEWISRDIAETASLRRQQRLRAAFVEQVDRLEIFKRDGYRCNLRYPGCNGRTDPSKVHPHPKAPVVDHVIPLAAGVHNGGVHAPSNCWTACSRCNSRKGDRGGGEQLMLIG